jgi:hypothetical protein
VGACGGLDFGYRDSASRPSQKGNAADASAALLILLAAVCRLILAKLDLRAPRQLAASVNGLESPFHTAA